MRVKRASVNSRERRAGSGVRQTAGQTLDDETLIIFAESPCEVSPSPRRSLSTCRRDVTKKPTHRTHSSHVLCWDEGTRTRQSVFVSLAHCRIELIPLSPPLTCPASPARRPGRGGWSSGAEPRSSQIIWTRSLSLTCTGVKPTRVNHC